MKYTATLSLRIVGQSGSEFLDHVDEFSEELSNLDDCNTELLDWSVGADAGLMCVEIDMTIEAASPGRAGDMMETWVRTAIHAAGGNTPGWNDHDSADILPSRYSAEAADGIRVNRLVDA